ncbi:MAG: glycosyltransferase family 2 protein, partial [Isosphaeraceae bacterium]
MLTLTLISLALALVSARLFRNNLGLYTAPPLPAADAPPPACSVLIPARNEENAIGAAVQAALASRGVEFEVIVLDDHSEDRTAEVVSSLARSDGRVRLASAPELPAGWCGKQHACWVLAGLARHPFLVFLDADVRIAPDALARMSSFLASSKSDLASGIPRQETVGLLEKLLIPLIHFILLGFLPIERMRRSRRPEFAAGCGQLFIADREGYDRCGGHSAIRESLHDGIKLPRAFRTAGLRTDLFDATDLATCRMYRSPREVWFGLAKNAGEALAAPAMIVPMTALLFLGQVLPAALVVMALASWPRPWPIWQTALAVLAAAAAYYPRLAAVRRFRQSLLGAVLHPLGVLLLLAIQWFAFARNALGRPSSWKGRPYPSPGARPLPGEPSPSRRKPASPSATAAPGPAAG